MDDLRWALRSLRANIGFTIVALLTLTLGIGASCAAFAVLDGVLLRPLPYREPDRLVFIRERTSKGELNPPSHPNFVDWRSESPAFDGLASAMFPYARTVTSSADGQPARLVTMGVSRGFFGVLGVRLAQGREFTADENRLGGPPVAMVSYDFWQTRMGGRLPLGRIRVGDQLTTVVGVTPPDFKFVRDADVYLPHEQSPGTCRTCRNYMVVGRLRQGVTLDKARREMTALSHELAATYGNDTMAADVDLTSLRDYLVGDYRMLLAIVFGASALVLLIACTNILSAQLARGWSRERDIVIRAALGASRGRLVQQLLTESAVLVTAGAACGVGLAESLTIMIRRLGSGVLPRLTEISIDGQVLGFVVAIVVVVTLLVGAYPAWRLSRGDPGGALRGARGSTGTVRASAWRGLVAFEIALALMLSIGAALLVRTVRNVMNHDTGIAARKLVTAAISPADADSNRFGDVQPNLAAIPGVDGVAFSTMFPLTWGSSSAPVRRRSDPLDRDWPAMAGFRIVSPNYFSVLGEPVLRGRSFDASDRAGAPAVAIVTRGIAERLWPGQDPIGKPIATNYLFDQWLTVVGVVAEASSWTMPDGSQNEIFVPMEQQQRALGNQGQIVALVRASRDPSSIIPSVRKVLRATIPNSPAQVGTLEERIAKTVADRRFGMLAIAVFACVALVLAGIGAYGVVWYVVATRTHEIGIRMALGATAGAVWRHVLTGTAAAAAGGVVAGSAGALVASRYLESTLYGVSRGDPTIYVVGAVITFVTVAVGVLIPAHRATRIDPLIAMRTET